MTTRWVFMLAAALASGEGFAQFKQTPEATPPVTRSVDVVDDYNGVKVADPYQWLENLGSVEVRAWSDAQTKATQAILRNEARRAFIRQRWTTHLDGLRAFRQAGPSHENDARIRIVDAPEGNRQIVLTRDDNGRVRVLADPGALIADASVNAIQASPDQRYVAVTSRVGGGEVDTLQLVRVADGVALPDQLKSLWLEPLWTHDSNGFFYVDYGLPPPGGLKTSGPAALRYHRLGTPHETDRTLLQARLGSEHQLIAQLSEDGRTLVVTEGGGAHTDGIDWLQAQLRVLDLGDARSPRVDGDLPALTEGFDAGYRLVGTGLDGRLHVLTDDNAPRRRLVAIDPKHPGKARWQDMIPQNADVLHRVLRIGQRYVAHYLRDGDAVIRVYDLAGNALPGPALPPQSGISDLERGDSDDEVVVTHSSFLRAPTRTFFNLRTGRTREEHADVHLEGGPYTVTRVRYPSRDGTLIPMSLIHRRDIALDGSNPVLMYGYGASHDPMVPGYSPGIATWLELGGVFAQPLLRGGGEFGRSWWEAATLANKQKSFDDFIAAAEYLARERWSRPKRIAIIGASNGGLLVTASLTERPDAFGAAVAQVPVTDLLRRDPGRHRGQMGWAGDPSQFEFVKRHSPLHRIVADRCYPPTLLSTSMTDENVPAWSAFKFAAALQVAQSCKSNPVLLRVDATGGHGGPTGEAGINMWLDIMMFVTSALGMDVPTPLR